jgi:hypothetical protein
MFGHIYGAILIIHQRRLINTLLVQAQFTQLLDGFGIHPIR